MYIPSTAHIYAQYSTEESGENWLKIRRQEVAAKANMEDAMVRVSNELHIKVASLTPVFKAAARDGKLLYYPFDTHWNSTGREIASTFMASILKKEMEQDSTQASRLVRPLIRSVRKSGS